MSADTAPRAGVHRESRMRNLGEAVPHILPRFGEKRPPASEGKKVGVMQAEHTAWLDGQETTSRCTECPDWSYTGPASEAREAAAAHRAELHPELVGRRTYRKRGIGRMERGKKPAAGEREAANAARAEREDAERLEKIERGRANRGELEEATVPALPAVVSSSPTTDDQEEPMDNPYGLQRFGRGYVWTIEVALQAVRDFAGRTGHPPTVGDGMKATIGTLPSSATAKRLFGGWSEMIVRAGFDRPHANTRYGDEQRTRTPRPAPAPQPDPTPRPAPQPEPDLPPAAEHTELVPVDAAPPGHTSSRLVQILSRLTSEDLEESADWYAAAISQLEHERDLIAQAIEAKAA